ncbi:sensor histidine kinase [Planosporangium thailandense]|uniref:Oxygen sensor histidine kinase NreB n=1 Tax=Planosporangium thailandense TaxID=765197 RepID=A0ABX0YAA4_9ACTN|nr:sensor histidine kinase [Planosporangium thailandense]NJC74179.1 sensor histidine kinase [Planosporangium thailandense]
MAVQAVPATAPRAASGDGPATRGARAALCCMVVAVAALTGGGVALAVLNEVGLRAALGEFFVATTAGAVSFGVVGVLVAARRPGVRVGWLFCAVAVTTAVPGFAAQYARYALVTHPGGLPAGRPLAWLADWTWVVGYGLLLVGVPLLFPDGHLPSRRWRPVVWLGAAAAGLTMAGNALSPAANPDLPEVANPYAVSALAGPADALSGVGTLMLMAATVGAVASLVSRYRRAPGPRRDQIRWLMFGAGVVAAGAIGVQVGGVAVGGYRDPVLLAYLETAIGPALAAAIGVAVLRHRLYDLDLWLNRTLVWSAMTALVIAGYVVVVGYLGAQLDVHGSGVGLIAAGLVAVAFHPVREQVQRLVNRMLYGRRDEPYAVLTELGRRLEATVSPQELLDTIVGTVREALRVPYAGVEVTGTTGTTIRAESGQPHAIAARLPLMFGTEHIGQLSVAARQPGESLGRADHRLLADFARQAGVAAHAVRLTTDLRAARERLVTAREEERRRLRRDLHDGLGPLLAVQTLTADTVRALLTTDVARADALLVELRTQAQQAVTDVRRIVHDLRPPVLDDRGLVAALREHAARYGDAATRVTVAAEPLPELPAAVEIAAYRIATEAVTNAARHAAAGHCMVTVGVADGALRVEVSDDGCGIPPDHRSGVGLTSMRERAEELGGAFDLESRPGTGTRLLATLPLPESS